MEFSHRGIDDRLAQSEPSDRPLGRGQIHDCSGIAVFATENAPWWDLLDLNINAANYHLGNFGMRLHVSPPRPQESPILLPSFTSVRPDYGDPGKVRAAAHKALEKGRGIPVRFTFLAKEAGLTINRGDKSANLDVDWLSYILINSKLGNLQGEVLLHELIHAADYSGDDDRWGDRFLHDLDPHSIMSKTWRRIPGELIEMQERHAAALRKAYFARAL